MSNEIFYTEVELNIASIFMLRGFITCKYRDIETSSKVMNIIIDSLNESKLYDHRNFLIFQALSILTGSKFKSEMEAILHYKKYNDDELNYLLKCSEILAEKINV